MGHRNNSTYLYMENKVRYLVDVQKWPVNARYIQPIISEVEFLSTTYEGVIGRETRWSTSIGTMAQKLPKSGKNYGEKAR